MDVNCRGYDHPPLLHLANLDRCCGSLSLLCGRTDGLCGQFGPHLAVAPDEREGRGGRLTHPMTHILQDNQIREQMSITCSFYSRLTAFQFQVFYV